MKTLGRWWRNIRWLLNDPPTAWTGGKSFLCDYCGKPGYIKLEDKVAVCLDCLKKALDKALKEEK